jgi:thymidylate synthase
MNKEEPKSLWPDKEIEKISHEESFRKIYKDVYEKGIEVYPRGTKCVEICNYNYTLPPYVRFANFKSRKLSLSYIKKEFMWYLRGDKYDTSICEHASLWKSLINRDGSINSNYGQYIFGTMNQFDNCVDILAVDKDTRRASMMILGAHHLLTKTKDYPCTYCINFRIRNNKLDMTVRMRSQDAIYGMGNDAPTFSFIHEMMYVLLKDRYLFYNDLEYGNYYHSCDSFHVYDKHYEMLNTIANKNDEYTVVDCPKISCAAEVEMLRSCDYSNVPENFKFIKWLIE